MAQFTIKDLAKKLGISPSTVSRALRDHPDISAKTKEKVAKLAAKHHYQPNQLAVSLQTRRSSTIGVIVPEIRHEFFSTTISGIEQVAYESGYTIMVCQSHETLIREILNTQALISNRVAGLLIAISTESTQFDHLASAMKQGVAVVQFDRVVEELDTCKVVIDDFKASYKITQHLIDRGYKRIGHIAGGLGIALDRKRYEGMRRALEDNGLPLDKRFVLRGGYREDDGIRGAEKLLQLPELPDAVLCINDPVAVGAHTRFKKAGLRIPDDIALAGFSDNPVSSLIDPPLTTIAQPAFEMGKVAARLLLEQLDDEDSEFKPTTTTLPTRLIVRKST